VVFHSLSSEDEAIGNRARPAGLYRSVCRIPGGLLTVGDYTIDVHFLHGAMTNYTSLPEALRFSIVDTAPRGDFVYLGRFLGTVHPKLAWRTDLIAAPSEELPPRRRAAGRLHD
jgi:hypothetical protein